jgi:hypothetical protein
MRWRTGEHQEENVSIPGIIKTDFYVVRDAWKRDKTPYRYMTEVYWPDRPTFEEAFYNPEYQKKLARSLEKIDGPLFLISEEVITQTLR